MTDWRDKAQAISERISEKRCKEKMASEQTEIERAKQIYGKNLARLQKRFKCHVCGKPSSYPHYEGSSSGNSEEDPKPGYPNWNKPGDLEKCSMCRNWVCKDHINHATHYHHGCPFGSVTTDPNGICQRCAEKL